MDRATKEALVASMNEMFAKAQAGFLVDFRGLSVEDANTLRRRLRDASAQMRVLKNNLAKIAIKGTPFEEFSGDIIDTRAFVYADDPVAPAKVVAAYQKENKKFSVIAGMLVKGTVGQKLDGEGVKSLATLPSRDELIAQFLSMLQAPASHLVRTLNEVPASFARTLSALAEARGAS